MNWRAWLWKSVWASALCAILISSGVGPGFLAAGVANAGPASRHDIVMREVGGQQIFFNQVTGKQFDPRGNNYIRLTDVKTPSGNIVTLHSTFDVGRYNPDEVKAALAQMHALGYNTVRVFVNVEGNGGLTGKNGLSLQYIANLAQFLFATEEYGIYVIITHDWLPSTDVFNRLLADGDPRFEGFSRIYLTPGGVAASQVFWSELAGAIRSSGASSRVLAYEIQNEYFYDTYYEGPFRFLRDDPGSTTPYTVTAADGNTYNLRDPNQTQAMMDSGMLYFLGKVQEAIKDADPDALVTNGYFDPFYGDARKSNPGLAIYESDLDFVDLHLYPHEFWHHPSETASDFRLSPDAVKPVIIGEFGAFRGHFGRIPFETAFGDGSHMWSYTDNKDAVAELINWQIAMCDYGIDGWLTWTWDTNEQAVLFSAVGDASLGDRGVDLARGVVYEADGLPPPLVDPSHDIVGYIAYWLSPMMRPDACKGLQVTRP